MKRYAMRTDAAQAAIVDGLRQCGVTVFIIGQPVDLLTYYRGRWLPLEVKTATKTGRIRKRKDQPEQDATLAACGIPRVTTVEQALAALRIT